MTTTVVIVTMPRSGSSLLAGVLHRLGIPMGPDSDLVAGRHLNRHGCHEDQAFQRISLNMLLEAGLLLDLSQRLRIDEQRVARVVRQYTGQIRDFVGQRRQPIWGFKDPGLAYTLPYLHQHLANPRYLHLQRDTGDTARSLFRTFRPAFWWPELCEKLPLFTIRNRMRLVLQAAALLVVRQRHYHDLDFFKKVICQGHARAERFLRHRQVLTIELADLVTKPEVTIARIMTFLNHNPDGDALSDAHRFIQPELLGSGQSTNRWSSKVSS
jgi:hypothetical protein